MASGKTPMQKVPPEQYGPNYRDHLLEQYKLYVEMADHVSERRASANNYLLTVNSALITLYGVALAALVSKSNRAWQYLIPAAGVLVCVTWLALIRSYRELNTAKFRVIHEIEQYLPIAAFELEWSFAERGQGKKYTPLTHLEPYIPWVFVGLYLLLGISALWKR